jgi:2-succinyl-6-hydroxy-2,4-cyclohexadiene-1-carboxylate synthase
MAEDMAALLRHLRVGSAVVVGHSMGGAIAGCLAAEYPETVDAAAILDKSAAGLPPADRQSAAAMEDPVTKHWPMPFDSLREAREYIRRDIQSELGFEYFMNSLTETAEGYTMMYSPRAMAANIANYGEWFDILPKIRCPVLLVRARGGEAVGDADFLRMQALIPDCTAREMSESDHNVHLSKPDEFYGYFDEWMNGRVLQTAGGRLVRG